MGVRAKIAWIIILALTLAACASDGEQAEPADSPTTEADAASSPDAEGADVDPEVQAAYEEHVEAQMPGVSLEMVQAAAEEGVVVWYHLRLPSATEPLVEEFQSRFPFIEVQEFEDSGGALFERFMSEQRAGAQEVDLFQTAAVSHIQSAAEEGYIAEYKAGAQADLPPEAYAEGEWYAYGFTTQSVHLYNSDLVSEAQADALDTYEGLWSDELADLAIGVQDAASAVAGQSYFYMLDEEYGRDSWEAIAARDPSILGPTPLVDAVVSGELAVAAVSESVVFPAYDSGAPVRWRVAEPAIVSPWPQAVVQEAPHPNAGRLLAEFLLSKAGQEIFTANAVPSYRSDVESLPAAGDESWFKPFVDRERYTIDNEAFSTAVPDLVDDWSALFLN